MGYDLYREQEANNIEPVNDYFRWNIWGFPPIYALGELYGWEPMGCISSPWTDDDGVEHEEEPMGYFSNDGQTVCGLDAQNWANALKKAVKELTPSNVEKTNEFNDEFWATRTAIRNGDKDAITKWFSSTDSIQYIRDYITFLEGGSFNIC